MRTRFGEFWQVRLSERPSRTSEWVLRLGVIGLLMGMILPSTVCGQDVRGGLRVGPSFGFLNDRAVPFISTEGATRGTPHARVDVHAGAFGIVDVASATSLEFDLLFVRKGGHFSSLEKIPATGTVYISEQVQLSYLQGQVLARRDLWPSGPLSFHAMVGVSVDVTLSGHLRTEVRTRSQVEQRTIPLVDRDLVARWGMGGVVGGSVGYPVGQGRRIALDVRYNPGFGAVFDRRHSDVQLDVSLLNAPRSLRDARPALRHDVLTVSVSYTIPLWSRAQTE